MAKKKKSGGIHIEGNRIEIHGDVVGRDKITNYLIQGINGLSTDYSDRIKNFIVEYLGTPDKPVPFGGRQTELAALDAWLADPAAPPYALIAAEAGRGKSALLTRWMQSVLERDLAHVVFIPISIRFNTALESVTFTALAARLGQIYGEPVKFADLSAQQWRGVCLSYLNRPPPDDKPLLVILDGLDEAADWHAGPDMFPLDPPRGIHALVSARYLGGDVDDQGWLRRLSWDSHERARSLLLPALTREGVSDVLAAMGHPLDKLTTQVDVIGELFRLSEGDPLLVRLYVEALLPYSDRAATLHPEDLPSIKEGLAGYFERWWVDQRQQWKLQGRDPLTEGVDVLNFFNLCAVALGPLSTNDAAEIASGGLASGLRLKAVAEGVARFVIGDGRARGYVFSHPRLNQFFLDQMTTTEHAEWAARFLAYGRRTLEALNVGSLAANKAPAYAVQYYGAHLERAEAQATNLYALVSEGWLRAWEALEGTYAGFLNDTERAWQQAEAEHEIAMQIKCALCRASITALSANIPPELLALAVQHKVLTPLQALVIARQIPNESQRALALVALASHLPKHLIADTLTTVWAIEDKLKRAKVLAAFATHLSEHERAKALQYMLADMHVNKYEHGQAEALAALAPYLSEHLMAKALVAARTIRYAEYRVNALTALAPYLPEDQRAMTLQDALTAAQAIEQKRAQAKALAMLAPHLPEHLMVNALVITLEIEDKRSRAEALAVFIPHLPEHLKAEVLQDALAAVRAIKSDEGAKAQILVTLAHHLTEQQRVMALQEALTVALAIKQKQTQVKALTALIPHLPEHQRAIAMALQDALTVTLAIENQRDQAKALAALAPHLSEHLMAKALVAARTIRYTEYRVNALTALAPYLPEDQRAMTLQDALAAARAIEDEWDQADFLAALVPHLPEHQRAMTLQDALVAARASEDERDRAKALAAFVPHLPEHLKAEVLQDTLAATRMFKYDEGAQAQILVTLAPYLPRHLIIEALTITRTIEQKRTQAKVLAALIPHLPEGQKASALQDALAAARAIEQQQAQAKALTALIPYLPAGQRASALQDALAAAQAIEQKRAQVEVLTALIPHLPEDQRASTLQDALAAARALKYDGYQQIKRATGLQNPLSTVLTISYEEDRVKTLIALVPHLTEQEKAKALQDAFTFAQAIRDRNVRARLLIELTHHFPEHPMADALMTDALMTDALTTAQAIKDKHYRAEALAALTSNLASWALAQPTLVYKVWKPTLRELSSQPRPEFLRDIEALIPFIFALVKKEEKTQTAADIFEAIQEVGRWWP